MDIVKRLRDACKSRSPTRIPPNYLLLCQEAADEIERLLACIDEIEAMQIEAVIEVLERRLGREYNDMLWRIGG